MVKESWTRPSAAIVALVGVASSCGDRTGLTVIAATAPVDPRLVAACVKLVSCEDLATNSLFSGYASVSDCIWVNVTAPPSMGALTGVLVHFSAQASITCLSSAAGCTDVDACVRGTVGLDCAQPITPSLCEGTLSINCVEGQPLASDCSVGAATDDPGGQCVDAHGPGTPYATCGVGACGGSYAVCNGNVSEGCRDGVQHQWTCPQGTFCATSSGSCVGDGAACQTSRCEGSTRVNCLGSHEWRVACQDLPIAGTCAQSGQGEPTCVPDPHLACDPSQYTDRCDGSHLQYCDGQGRTVDCAALGFKSCQTGRTLAACAP